MAGDNKILGQFNLGETFEINYSAPDGTDVQGWYILPPEFDDSKKYPLILIIHGGPHAMYRPQFNYLWHQFASDGYIVLFTNPRGSTGYGSDFANVIDNDYPGPGDLSDLLAGVDYVTNLGIVDERNMFVQGCSGGGVLTAAVVSRLIGGKTDVVMMLNGAIAGLVAITAEPLAPSPLAAIFIGAIGGLVMYFSTQLLFKLKIDDVVGAIPAHLVAGVWGTLAVPLTNGDVSFGAQFLGTISIVVFVFVVSLIVFQIMKATIGLRISKEAEKLGTDKAEIGVIAYGIRD